MSKVNTITIKNSWTFSPALFSSYDKCVLSSRCFCIKCKVWLKQSSCHIEQITFGVNRLFTQFLTNFHLNVRIWLKEIIIWKYSTNLFIIFLLLLLCLTFISIHTVANGGIRWIGLVKFANYNIVDLNLLVFMGENISRHQIYDEKAGVSDWSKFSYTDVTNWTELFINIVTVGSGQNGQRWISSCKTKAILIECWTPSRHTIKDSIHDA